MSTSTDGLTPMDGATVAIETLPVRRALIAVADKEGAVDLARALVQHGVTLVSTGNTARVLEEADVPVTSVAELTGSPEMLEGRVKTLHPRVHAAILADKRKPEHLEELEARAIEPFDLVVVNLYPFLETVLSGAGPQEVVEQIDIGGPALVRAAAKNFESVAVAVRPLEYGSLLAEIEASGGISRATRRRLAREAFEHVSAYDTAIAGWFGSDATEGVGAGDGGAEETLTALAAEGERFLLSESGEGDVDAEAAEPLPPTITLLLAHRGALRYGENPHQRGGLYAAAAGPGPLGGAEVLQGKDMSFNNWLDAESARAAVSDFHLEGPAAVIVKHNNPCGVAVSASLAQAYERALEGDRVSAFGGIVAFNGPVDGDVARAMAGVFTEVVVAPSYSEEALALFAERPNLRLVRAPPNEPGGLEIRPIDGGALVQDIDRVVESRSDMRIVSSREPTTAEWDDLLFAWKVAARVRSNAIVLVSGRATVGIGAGQMNRLTSVEVAARQAAERAGGSCLASDAFFPFRDGLDRAAEAGVAAVIQPGGSVRDDEVLAAAEDHGMAMVLTARRHFRH